MIVPSRTPPGAARAGGFLLGACVRFTKRLAPNGEKVNQQAAARDDASMSEPLGDSWQAIIVPRSDYAFDDEALPVLCIWPCPVSTAANSRAVALIFPLPPAPPAAS